jgi:hypothetical protein
MKEVTEKRTSPQLMLELEVRDKNGKLLNRKKTPAKSWLKAFITILKGEFGTRTLTVVGSGATSVVDETGTARSYPLNNGNAPASYFMNLSTLGDTGDTSLGIIVGTSDTANSLTTYALGGKIANGIGSGQLLYGTESIEDVSNPSGNDLQFRMTRTFTNNSGSTITVKEVGLLIKKYDAVQVSRSFLAARDVLPSAVDVPDGATLTIRYVVKITIA